MHIPNDFLDPKMSVGLLGAAVLVLGYCLAKARQALTAVVSAKTLAVAGNAISTIGDKGRRVLTRIGAQKLTLMGMVGALVFAAQMFNFPVQNGTSGHLIGGVFASVLLGPFAGTLVISAVVIIQALFYADGGLLTLGANLINLGFVPAAGGYYIYYVFKKFLPAWLSIALAAFLSVVAAALVCALEAGLSGTLGLAVIIPAMLKVHVLIGAGEAVITLWLLKLSENFISEEALYENTKSEILNNLK